LTLGVDSSLFIDRIYPKQLQAFVVAGQAIPTPTYQSVVAALLAA
jgi:hypothetical protein